MALVLASGDAHAFGGTLNYLLADEAHARMREHPYFNVKAFTEAWQSVVCRAVPCGPGSPWQKQRCIARGQCQWSSHEELVRGTFTDAQFAEYVKLRAFILDVLRTRQWDRIGIRSKRYPGIER